MNGIKHPKGSEPIAIVGMACRLPGGASSPSKLWDLLEARQSAQSDVPKNRFNVDTWYHPDPHRPGSINTRGGYFLGHDDGFRDFDPSFFGINLTEAASMDPQQRKLLEVVYEAFESAGAHLDDLSGSNTACYIGNFTWDIGQMQARDVENGVPYHMTGGGLTILSNRVNYLFNLKGPSMTIDTACSSSMYALHHACQSLEAGDCSAAIVGGTNLIFGIEQHIGSVRLGVLSPTSICHTFDEAADGYARAEGVGALYLKRLSDAISDRDPIRAVVRSTSINANGRSSGISQPSSAEQEVVIRKAYAKAGIGFNRTGYFENHGTGTFHGDPTEVVAIGNVFAEQRTAEQPLLMGSVKTNLGHSEAASALASLIKVVLALENGRIPATIGIKKLNPNIDFKAGRLKVVQEMTDWPAELDYRRASVNSFGYGGANAHAIIDATISYLGKHHGNFTTLLLSNADLVRDPKASSGSASHPPRTSLLVFSAHDEPTLQRNIKAISLVADKYRIVDLAYTLGLRRSNLYCRAFAVASEGSVSAQLLEDNVKYGVLKSPRPTMAFVFTGQGAQWPQMGYSLMVHFPSVRRTFQELDDVLGGLPNPPDWTIIDSLAQPKGVSKINEVTRSQPLCTAIQIALVVLLRSWGIRPSAVVGHSSGEIAAAFAADLVSASQAIIIAYQRGVSAARCNVPGAMLAVGVGAKNIRKIVDQHPNVVIACHNSPESVTLSGMEAEINEIRAQLTKDGVFCRKLQTAGNAYHSPLMKDACEDYELALKSCSVLFDGTSTAGSGKVQMYSSLIGTLLAGNNISTTYWRKNLESPVLFDEALQRLLSSNPTVDHVIEIGPHSALGGPVKEVRSALDLDPALLTYLPSLKRGGDGVNNVLTLAGTLFLAGHPVDIHKVNTMEILQQENGRRGTYEPGLLIVDLPTYQWNYENCLWTESRLSREVRFRGHPRHDLLGSIIPGTSLSSPSWRNLLQLKHVPWLRDHKIGEDFVFPAAGYIAMAVESVNQIMQTQSIIPHGYSLQNVKISSAMVLSEQTATEVVFDVRALHEASSKELARGFSFKASSVSASNEWVEHAVGEIFVELIDRDPDKTKLEIKGTRGAVSKESSDRRWYSAMSDIGLRYGPAFKPLSGIRAEAEKNVAVAEVSTNMTKGLMDPESKYVLHPTAIDGCLQLSIVAAHEGNPNSLVKPYLPVMIERLTIWDRPTSSISSEATAHGHAIRYGLRSIHTNLSLIAEDGHVLLQTKAKFLSLENSLTQAQQTNSRQPYTRLVWKPDFDKLSNSQMNELFGEKQEDKISHEYFQKLEEISSLSILDSLERISNYLTYENLPSHLQKFVEWLKAQGRLLAKSRLSRISAEQRWARIAQIASSVAESVPEALMVAKLNSRMPEIISGAVGPLDVMIEDDLMNSIYESGFGQTGAYSKLMKVVELIAHKEPRLRVLELGAGTGGATRPMLKVLEGNSRQPKYIQYTFTDVSTAFLGTAQVKFRDYKNMDFRILNIENDPLGQGFDHDSYDLILASNVVHATSNIVTSLQNCKKLLKPNGKLLIVETTKDRLVAGFMLGTLPGYWLGAQDGRPSSPFISRESWHARLLDAGFPGIGVALSDYPEPDDCTSVMIASKALSNEPTIDVNGNNRASSVVVNGDNLKSSEGSGIVWLIYRHRPHALVAEITLLYRQAGIQTRVVALSDIARSIGPGSRCLMFAELEGPFLSRMSHEEMAAMKHLTLVSASTAWVTNGGILTGSDPEQSLVFGLAKSIMTEQPSFHLSTFDIDPDETNYNRSARALFVHELSLHDKGAEQIDTELVEKNGVIYISRYTTDDIQNASFERQLTPRPETLTLRPGLSLDFTQVGQLQSYYFKETGAQDAIVKPGHVRLDARAFGLEKLNCAVLKGHTDSSFFSYECGAVVSQVGAGVTRLKIGDRVICQHPERFATTFAVPEDLCQPIQDDEDFEGMSVFIDAAGDAFGLAAVQIARMSDTQLYATFATDEEKRLLSLYGGIPDDNLIDVRSETFAYDIKLIGDAHGFDVILAARGVESAREMWSYLRRDGRLIKLGQSDSVAFNTFDSSMFSKGATLSHFNINNYLMNQLKHPDVSRSVVDLYRKGFIKPLPFDVFDISNFTDAVQKVDNTGFYGKAVLSCSPQSLVPVHISPSPLMMKSDVTYLLVGCLGGLGRSLVTWMVARGARHFIFLSRSGTDKAGAAALVADLESFSKTSGTGLTVQVARGDVSRREDVARAISMAKRPIKGVIQAAMVLRDALFNAMSLEMFNAALHPKVLGTINLHELLIQEDLDFFVMTSSVLGAIGAATQSNYSAANAFLDHMARHRQTLGLQGTSIALGMIVEVGHVEEHPEVETALKRNGMYGINEDEYLRTMELAMRRREDLPAPTWGWDSCASSHIVTGMDPSRVSRAGGKTLWLNDNRLRNLVMAMGGLSDDKQTADATRSTAAALKAAAALGEEALRTTVRDLLLEKFSNLVLTPVARMSSSKPLASYGMDSMIGAEIRSWAWKEFHADVPFLTLLDQALTFEQLAEQLSDGMDPSLKAPA